MLFIIFAKNYYHYSLKTMKCVNCYREIADGLKFCPKCGFMQPTDREAYELEHPELADAIPEDEMLETLAITTNPSESQQPADVQAEGVAASTQEATQQAAVMPGYDAGGQRSAEYLTPQVENQPINYMPPQVETNQEGFVECPVCHNPIAFGTSPCPHCKQLLDWGDSESQPGEKTSVKASKELWWVLLGIVLAAALAVAGYFIFGKGGKKKHRSSHHYSSVEDVRSSSTIDSTRVSEEEVTPIMSVEDVTTVDVDDNYNRVTTGPTGIMERDARDAVERILSIMESIYTFEDCRGAENEVEKIVDEYEAFYRDCGQLDEFEVEIRRLWNDPEINSRYERIQKRIERIKL